VDEGAVPSPKERPESCYGDTWLQLFRHVHLRPILAFLNLLLYSMFFEVVILKYAIFNKNIYHKPTVTLK
jgi:hypothetical protein